MMRPRSRHAWLVVTLTGGLFVQSLFSGLASAQQPSSLVWDKPVTVTRKEKPKHIAPRPRPKVERAPLLTLQWRVLKRGEGGTAIETNPTTTFHTGDQLRLAIKANQDGYLYIIHHSEGQEGTLIFPDSRINEGQNIVKKDQEYVVPAFCPKYKDPRDCWWEMTPPGGREVFTVIFSRDMIADLPNKVAESGQAVKEQTVKELQASSGQVLKRTSRPNLTPQQGGGAGRYVTWVTNSNLKDNEELIETIVLTHGG